MKREYTERKNLQNDLEFQKNLQRDETEKLRHHETIRKYARFG